MYLMALFTFLKAHIHLSTLSFWLLLHSFSDSLTTFIIIWFFYEKNYKEIKKTSSLLKFKMTEFLIVFKLLSLW